MAISPEDRERLIGDGCLNEHPLSCSICQATIDPGSDVHCNDGYDRVYGEYVLGEVSDLYEDNWPTAHRRCAEGKAHRPRRSADERVPRAVAIGSREEVARLARARLLGTAALGVVALAATAAVLWGGVGAGALVFGAGAGLLLVAWGLAARPRD